MLDFYLIKDQDSANSIAKDTDFELAGTLSEEAFNTLQNQGIIASKYDYWADFRWPYDEVNVMFEMLLKKYPLLRTANEVSNSQASELFTLLNKAVWKNYGLASFAD